ncbi:MULTISPECIES: CvpA family protein [unclassified Lentilitoribacter]|jgi:membrane protein required for colicin V production|uniref:CvpA family protein n=1 Tax=unclassified Lentilitoribacter TaxID=2647570 RepID=UPI0013A6A0FA|nr:CvpA family protein [Lentilitoribacter sp. Alg239-R112]
MPITLFDGIFIGVTLVSAMLAMVRGFSREVLAVASWVAAAAAAFFLYPYLEPYALQYTSSKSLAAIGSAAAIFLVTLIIVSYITMRLADFIIDSRIGVLDRTLGFVFGAARGVLIMVVAVQFLNWLIAEEKQPTWIAEAKSKPLLDSLGVKLVNILPEDADSSIIDSIRKKSEDDATGDTDA